VRGESPPEAISAQDKTQREVGKHSRNHHDNVFLLKFQCDLQEGRHLIYRYECLGEEKRKGMGVKLLKIRSNVST